MFGIVPYCYFYFPVAFALSALARLVSNNILITHRKCDLIHNALCSSEADLGKKASPPVSAANLVNKLSAQVPRSLAHQSLLFEVFESQISYDKEFVCFPVLGVVADLPICSN